MGIRLVFLIVASASFIHVSSDGFAAGQPNKVEKINRCIVCHAECLSAHAIDRQLQRDGCVTCHRGNDQTSRQDIAHLFLIGKDYSWYRLPQSTAVLEGAKLITRFACRRCHVQHNEGNHLATNLDQLLAVSPVAEITAALQVPAFYMPDFPLNNRDRDLLVTQVLAGGVGIAAPTVVPPLVVHFADKVDDQEVFEKYCGQCHRLLAAKRGGLGTGKIGPNLSGLLTKFYPLSYENQQHWTLDGLKGWLRNPRKTRPLTRMPPLSVSAAELEKLLPELLPLLSE